MIDAPGIGCSQAQAEHANNAFDNEVRRFLEVWLAKHNVSAASADREYIEGNALRTFFQHNDNALELLLADKGIAGHLLRGADEVYFQPDAYEPLLSTFEKRIYNLSANLTLRPDKAQPDLIWNEKGMIPFRYISPKRQSEQGDTLPATVDDIGNYFGNRRTDVPTLRLMAKHLAQATEAPNPDFPIHSVTLNHMVDSFRDVKHQTEKLKADGGNGLHCFIVQRRHHNEHDKHLGAALFVMDVQHPEKPQRIILCDTVRKPNGTAAWETQFKDKIDAAFPHAPGQPRISEMTEDGGVGLQRWHDGQPERHKDIDCAFYTESMAEALIRLARKNKDLVVSGNINDIVAAMTGEMKEYFERPNQPKPPVVVREVNVQKRWRAGQERLEYIAQASQVQHATTTPSLPIMMQWTQQIQPPSNAMPISSSPISGSPNSSGFRAGL